MRAPFAARLALACVALLPAIARAGARAPSFDTVFATRAAPRSFHARLLYRGSDGVHRLELWREGERLLRRDTEKRLTTIATRRAGSPDYRLDLLDHVRRIHTIVDRDSLYRVGRFTDWADLAHGLRRPAGPYRLRTAAPPRSGPVPIAPCRWYALDAAGRRTLLCWSAAEAFPLMILDGSGAPVWRVTALDHRRAPAALFRPSAPGYVLNDAAADISGD